MKHVFNIFRVKTRRSAVFMGFWCGRNNTGVVVLALVLWTNKHADSWHLSPLGDSSVALKDASFTLMLGIIPRSYGLLYGLVCAWATYNAGNGKSQAGSVALNNCYGLGFSFLICRTLKCTRTRGYGNYLSYRVVYTHSHPCSDELYKPFSN